MLSQIHKRNKELIQESLEQYEYVFGTHITKGQIKIVQEEQKQSTLALIDGMVEMVENTRRDGLQKMAEKRLDPPTGS